MSVLPVIEGETCDYTRLQALAWATNGPGDLATIDHEASRRLVQIASRHSRRPLVVDCSGISRIADHAFDAAAPAIQRSARPVLFAKAENLSRELADGLGSPTASYRVSEEPSVIYGYGSSVPDRGVAERTVSTAFQLLQSFLCRAVERSYHPFENGPRRLLSTPLIADGVFDARRLISDPELFLWVSIALGDRLNNVIEGWFDAVVGEDPPARSRYPAPSLDRVRLLAVSLRSSPFAAAVGLLLGHGLENAIEIVDHVGPKHRILEEHRIGPARWTGGEYILISDFVIGGTELKIAKAYAETRGGRLRHALSIGRMLDSAEYGLDIDISTIVDLRECNARPNYRFG